ncbi:uncharacterized protein MYCGRDRAFT_80233, partial [Zymoseptoria tritici IPO323]
MGSFQGVLCGKVRTAEDQLWQTHATVDALIVDVEGVIQGCREDNSSTVRARRADSVYRAMSGDVDVVVPS